MSGLWVAEQAKNYVQGAEEPVLDEAQVESQKESALRPVNTKKGIDPMELELSARYVCKRYVGMYKNQGRLLEGTRRMRSLRREFMNRLMAKTPHYLMRALEARNIMDLVDVHLAACLSRSESRGQFIRLDYTERDPSRDNMICIQRIENDKPVLEIREVEDLKPERKEEK